MYSIEDVELLSFVTKLFFGIFSTQVGISGVHTLGYFKRSLYYPRLHN